MNFLSKIFRPKPEKVFAKLIKPVLESDNQKVIRVLRKYDDEILDEVSELIEWMLQNSQYDNDTERETLVYMLRAIKKHKSTMYWD